MSYRAAVIGTGEPALYHLDSYSRHPQTEPIAIWGRDRDKLAGLQQIYDVPVVTTDLGEVLDRSDVDCVSICIPNHLHAELAVRALQAGKHVFCEVPMVPAAADAADLVDTVEETGLVFMVGQLDRFEPAFINIKRMVDSGELGKPFLAESAFVSRGWTRDKGLDWWGRDPANPQIVLVSLGCFPISLLRWVMGPVIEVSAYAARQAWPHQSHDDTIVANLRFQSGAIGRALISEAAQRPYALDLAVYGDEGTVINNQMALNRFQDVGRDEFVELPIPLISWAAYPDPQVQALFDREIASFVESIDAGTVPPVDAHEGAAIAATLDAMVQSIDIGQPVQLAPRKTDL